WKDRVRVGPAVPLGVEELAVDMAPGSGSVDDEHPGDRRAAEDIEGNEPPRGHGRCRGDPLAPVLFRGGRGRSAHRPQAPARPSGSLPVSRPTTVRDARSIAETMSALVEATQARLPSGAIRSPTGTGLFPNRSEKRRASLPATAPPASATRGSSFREARAKTATAPDCAHETRARLPSGVIFTRIGNFGTLSVAATARVFVSMTDTVSAPRLVTQTSPPSGEIAIPSAPSPVGMSLTTF